MRVHLFTALGALKVGMDILLKDEKVEIDGITFIIKERSATRLDLVRVETASEEKGK